MLKDKFRNALRFENVSFFAPAIVITFRDVDIFDPGVGRFVDDRRERNELVAVDFGVGEGD